jgi:hypothetical protein
VLDYVPRHEDVLGLETKLHAFLISALEVADNVQQSNVQQLSTYAKPEAASAVLGS